MNEKVRTAIEVILDSYTLKNYDGYKYSTGGLFTCKEGLSSSTYAIDKLEDRYGNYIYRVYSFSTYIVGFVDRDGARIIWRILTANGYKSNREGTNEINNR